MPLRILTACVLYVVVSMHTHAQTAHYTRSNTAPNDSVKFALSGGAFKSYGCKAIDPTYWMANNGNTVTVTFAKPEANPSFRVWGMNTDDMASVSVNGAPYPLTPASASYSAKVVCGTSPGPDGVLFADGNLVGANTPGEANFSYQDIQLKALNVTSITVTGLKGAGWGFAGVSVYRESPVVPSATEPPVVPSAAEAPIAPSAAKPPTVQSDTKPQSERETSRPKR